MKMKSSDSLVVMSLVIGLLLTMPAHAFQQSAPTPDVRVVQRPAATAFQDRDAVPSPLSQLDKNFEKPAYYSSELPVTQYVTHDVDLRETLLGHSLDNQCTMTEAFQKLEKQLGMIPLGAVDGKQSLQNQSRSAVYKIAGNDVYTISAKQSFFNALHLELQSFRYGNKQIIVEVRFFEIPEEDVAVLQSFMIPGTFKTFGNRLPIVESFASNGTFAHQRDLGPDANGSNSGAAHGSDPSTFVLATETRTKAYPTFIGNLDDRGTRQLVKFSKSRAAVDIVQAPTITMFPGQRATVNDGSLRPFVVSVKKVADGTDTAFQPVIQLLEDGAKIAIKADTQAGKVKLSGDIAFSKILGVESFAYPSTDPDGSSVTIQVPEHRIRKVHWSAEVESDQAILIDSVETFEKEIKAKTRFKAAVTKTMRRLVMITPRIIEDTEELAQESETQKLPR